MATILYFPVQLVVALAWPQPYSLMVNTISDLGITTCGMSNPFPGREVFACSPRHLLMNMGFLVVGVMTAAGAVLTWRVWPRRRLTTTALLCVITAGVGGVLVGIAPSDIAPQLHSVGALFQVPGVIAPLLLGLALRHQRPRLGAFSIIIGAIGVVGTALFALQPSANWFGALERLALDPFTLWTFVLGSALLATLTTTLSGLSDEQFPSGMPGLE
ncbi:DUF998 domain-containing protein [Nonomuraea sp. NPDC048916]|uniref:DUF998 domain-containing protein n=1 Tax=Nonomuraea sp. NPDC048916 TaxID=3154232 RepID=UPI003410C6B4